MGSSQIWVMIPMILSAFREASVLVVGAGYQAVQWACELGSPAVDDPRMQSLAWHGHPGTGVSLANLWFNSVLMCFI